MSENIKNLEEEFRRLKQRVESLETMLGQGKNERTEEPRVDDLYRWQKIMPQLENYDIWSIVLTKKQGTDDLGIGHLSVGADYARITDLPHEDAANLAGALSHPARIMILRECQRAAQYASDLEKTVSAKYGALYHHINSLVEAKLVDQEKERGKYITTSVGKAALLFLNILASVIASIEVQAEKTKIE